MLLRDRTQGDIKPDRRSSGPDTSLSTTEEKSLCEHVREITMHVYVYFNCKMAEASAI